MPRLLDRVRDTTSTTGTGQLTFSGTPPSTFVSFSVLPVGSKVDYTITHATLNEFEVGIGTFLGSNLLNRDVVRISSNASNLVNFSAGNKDVFVTVAAASINSRGRILATNYAMR